MKKIMMHVVLFLVFGTTVLVQAQIPYRMQSKLNLNADQKTKLAELRSDHQKTMADLRADVQKKLVDLRTALQQENLNEKDVLNKTEDLNTARNKAALERSKMLVKVAQILTPEQRLILKENAPMPKKRFMNKHMGRRMEAHQQILFDDNLMPGLLDFDENN